MAETFSNFMSLFNKILVCLNRFMVICDRRNVLISFNNSGSEYCSYAYYINCNCGKLGNFEELEKQPIFRLPRLQE